MSGQQKCLDAWRTYAVIVGVALVISVAMVLCLSTAGSIPSNPGGGPSPAPLVAATPYLAACQHHPSCGSLGLEGDCCPTIKGVLLGCCEDVNTSVVLPEIKGMCYTPAPARDRYAFVTDDYMADWSKALWGGGGSRRDDLQTIADLGSNIVRLYGNDPSLDHKAFLDRADELGLGVIVAFSNYPYTQDPVGKCATDVPYDCFNEIQLQYEMMLANGFTTKQISGNRQYHPAIKAIILMNEPELKITFNGEIQKEAISRGYYAKALLSAFDGVMMAEKTLHVRPDKLGRLPPFTVAHSFGPCNECLVQQWGNTVTTKTGVRNVGDINAVGYMYDFTIGCLKPSLFAYQNRTDLIYGLQNRFAFSFNTQDQASVICDATLQFIAATPFKNIPTFVGEYKATWQSLPTTATNAFKDDLTLMTNWIGHIPDDPTQPVSCAGYKGLRGISVFEFQVSYWKGHGAEEAFGMYELGSNVITQTDGIEQTGWKEFDVNCLHKKQNNDGDNWIDRLAEVFGGKAPDDSSCKGPYPDWKPPYPPGLRVNATKVLV